MCAMVGSMPFNRDRPMCSEGPDSAAVMPILMGVIGAVCVVVSVVAPMVIGTSEHIIPIIRGVNIFIII